MFGVTNSHYNDQLSAKSSLLPLYNRFKAHLKPLYNVRRPVVRPDKTA